MLDNSTTLRFRKYLAKTNHSILRRSQKPYTKNQKNIMNQFRLSHGRTDANLKDPMQRGCLKNVASRKSA